MYMLDTNICIHIIKKRPPGIRDRLNTIGQSHAMCISVVTYAELQYGVERSSAKKRNQGILDALTGRVDVLPWDERAARQYGKIRSVLEIRGTAMGNIDMLIAAHALSRECILVTTISNGFDTIRNLKCENWL